MGKRAKTSTLEVFAAILVLLIFSGFYFFLAPYINEDDSEKNTAAEHTAAVSQKQAEEPTIEKNKQEKPDSEYLILVNKKHRLEKRERPEDLKQVEQAVKDRPKKQQKLRAAAAAAFRGLSAAGEKEGCTIRLTTGYRSYAYQKKLYEQYVKTDGRKKADQYSARPGHSEHETGLCADVSAPSVDYRLTKKLAKTKEGKWLARNAHKYGYIIRYPKGRQDITGYQYEPWHIRYVGKEAAKEIYEKDLTLEEYLGDVDK